MTLNSGVEKVVLTVRQAACRRGGYDTKRLANPLTCSSERVLLWVSAEAAINKQPNRYLVALNFVNNCPACCLQMKRL